MSGEIPRTEAPSASETPAEEGPTSVGGTRSVSEVIEPGSVRRAPRFRAFFAVGALLGVVAGIAVGFSWWATAGSSTAKPGVTFAVLLIVATGLGTLTAGVCAVIADRRSVR